MKYRKKRKAILVVLSLIFWIPFMNISLFYLNGLDQDYQYNSLLSENPKKGVERRVKQSNGEILNGWLYQQKIMLDPPTPVDDYQVKIQLSMKNFNYSKCNNDGSDLRFTDEFSNLSYWIESWNNTDTSIVWVNVSTAGTSHFYIHYGNPSAISESNGDNTFLFFDDFLGTYIDTGKWLTETDGYSTRTVSDGIVSLKTDTPNDAMQSVHIGFNDFYVEHGNTFGAKEPNGITLGRAYGPSNLFFTKNGGHGEESLNVYFSD